MSNVRDWYDLLVHETRALVQEVRFGIIASHMPYTTMRVSWFTTWLSGGKI